jgi:hypothetical protein
MGLKTATQPRLPAAPDQYDRQYMEQLINVLRLYFNQLDNASPAVFASQNVGSTTAPVISALTCAQPDLAVPGASKVSLPTQADFAYLRAGDIYYDTTAGNVLKIKV